MLLGHPDAISMMKTQPCPRNSFLSCLHLFFFFCIILLPLPAEGLDDTHTHSSLWFCPHFLDGKQKAVEYPALKQWS